MSIIILKQTVIRHFTISNLNKVTLPLQKIEIKNLGQDQEK